MRRGLSIAAAAALAAGVLACGGVPQGSGDTDPAALAPADAPFYVDALVDPTGEQEGSLAALLERFPELGDPAERIPELIDEALREADSPTTYAEDIEPWLGDRIGVFVSPTSDGEDADVAIIVATTDEEAARTALEQELEGAEERSHEGVDYLYDEDQDTAAGIVDGFLVSGTEPALQAAAEAAAGEALIDSERFSEAVATVEGDPLASFYFDGPAFVDLAAESDSTTSQAELSVIQALTPSEPTITTVSAEPDALVMDSSSSGLTALAEAGLGASLLGTATDSIEDLPADSWVAFGQPDVGETVASILDAVGEGGGPWREQVESSFAAATGLDLESDLLDWLGDAAFFVRGTDLATLGGGAVIESRDPAASKRALEGFERVLSAGGEVTVQPSPIKGIDEGFSVVGPGVPQPVNVVQRDDRVVAAYGEPATTNALSPPLTLADDPDYRAAADSLGSEYEAAAFIEVAPILELADGLGAASDPDYTEVKPYLERFAHIVSGTREEGDAALSRTIIELE